MTDNLQLSNSDVTTANSSPAPVVQQSAPMEPRMVPQHEVDKVVGAVKSRSRDEGYNEGYKRAQEELMKTQNAAPGYQTQAYQQPAYQQSQQGQNDIRSIVREEFTTQLQQMQHNQYQQQVVKELENKLLDAKARYGDDFNSVVQGIEQGYFTPELLLAANTVDNTGDVLHDLRGNLGKLAQINALPPAARPEAIKQLSDSIKQNQSASSIAQKLPNAPLSQYKSSTSGGVDKGKLGFRDIKANLLRNNMNR